MIFIRHTDECAGKPNAAGRLTGTCDCATARLDQEARTQLEALLGKLADDSIEADEQSEYFALRLDELAEQVAKASRNVRRTAARADREGRLRAQRKRARSA